jgi:hypothetical protein
MISETWIDRDCFAALAMTAWQTFYETIKFVIINISYDISKIWILPKGETYHSTFCLSRIFESAKIKISASYEIMFVTSISSSSLPKLTPYIVLEPKIHVKNPKLKIHLTHGQNLIQGSEVRGQKTEGRCQTTKDRRQSAENRRQLIEFESQSMSSVL